WIERAKTQTQKELEREVAKVSPAKAKRERRRPAENDQVNLSGTISAETESLYLRAKNLECQRLSRSASLDDVMREALLCYLHKHDPKEKEKRACKRTKPEGYGHKPERPTAQNNKKRAEDSGERAKGKASSTRGIAKPVARQVWVRDQGRCAQVGRDGRRCDEMKWLQIHHLVPRSMGGGDELGNLTLLCAGHHRLLHAD
ncbi:MAG TPA: HNH endonuclease signature motif containing protein, partial [Bdellovibrionales bacterium]|nr:HNH endonuclease signature motif containing protein [Bdellovibrionales bacterium]